MSIAQLGRFGGAAPDATRTFGKRTVGGVIDKHLEARADRIALGPDDDVTTRIIELLRDRAAEPADIVFSVVIDPRSLIAIFRAEVVGGRGSVVARVRAPDGLDECLGTWRSDLATHGVFGCEFFRMLAIDIGWLFKASPDVAEDAGRVIAEGRIGDADWASAIEVHTTIKLQHDVFRRAVGSRDNAQWRATLHHRNARPVAVILRR